MSDVKEVVRVTTAFKNAQSKGLQEATKYAEEVFDNIYALEKNPLTENDQFSLIQLYLLVGHLYKAEQLTQTLLQTTESKKRKTYEKKRNELLQLRKAPQLPIQYKDLRNARLEKEPNLYTKEDFIQQDEGDDTFSLYLKEAHQFSVILNKHVKCSDITLFFKSESALHHIDDVLEYLYWISDAKEELIEFYNNHHFEYKYPTPVDEEWYHGLDPFDGITIEMDTNGELSSSLLISDYYNQLGFELQTIGQAIASIEYRGEI